MLAVSNLPGGHYFSDYFHFLEIFWEQLGMGILRRGVRQASISELYSGPLPKQKVPKLPIFTLQLVSGSFPGYGC
jgi:hypothetical protein